MTQTPRKKTSSKPATASRDRVVYEVKGPQGTRQVDASTTAQLKATLAPLLGLEPYSVQAVAHLAHVERATAQGHGWSVRRVGVLTFQPDTLPTTPATPPKGPQKAEQAPEGGTTPTTTPAPPSADPLEVQPGPQGGE